MKKKNLKQIFFGKINKQIKILLKENIKFFKLGKISHYHNNCIKLNTLYKAKRLFILSKEEFLKNEGLKK